MVKKSMSLGVSLLHLASCLVTGGQEHGFNQVAIKVSARAPLNGSRGSDVAG